LLFNKGKEATDLYPNYSRNVRISFHFNFTSAFSVEFDCSRYVGWFDHGWPFLSFPVPLLQFNGLPGIATLLPTFPTEVHRCPLGTDFIGKSNRGIFDNFLIPAFFKLIYIIQLNLKKTNYQLEIIIIY
jgi:hypothetical protein